MQILWEEALGVPDPGIRLPMTYRLKGGGGGKRPSVSELSLGLDPDDESNVEELSKLESLHLPDLDDFFF